MAFDSKELTQPLKRVQFTLKAQATLSVDAFSNGQEAVLLQRQDGHNSTDRPQNNVMLKQKSRFWP